MYSVTQRVSQVKQPRGGYINPRTLTAIPLVGADEPIDQKSENVFAGLVGIAVDYLTRWSCGTPVKTAFHISFLGAEVVHQTERAWGLAESIVDLSNDSITAACQLAGYDSAYRAGAMAFRPVENILPDEATCDHIRTMVRRGISFFDEYGPVTHDGITFPGGYTDIVSAGDGDFMTEDTVWDFKVSVKPPTNKHTLQICMYWLMGLHSEHAEDYRAVKRLGFFNPRLGVIYTIDVKDIDSSTKRAIETDVIGYDLNDAVF